MLRTSPFTIVCITAWPAFDVSNIFAEAILVVAKPVTSSGPIKVVSVAALVPLVTTCNCLLTLSNHKSPGRLDAKFEPPELTKALVVVVPYCHTANGLQFTPSNAAGRFTLSEVLNHSCPVIGLLG
jgi:hypothetical protein